jgi:hypothetical protein
MTDSAGQSDQDSRDMTAGTKVLETIKLGQDKCDRAAVNATLKVHLHEFLVLTGYAK